MPDPILFLTAGAVSALVSAALLLLLGRPRAAPDRSESKSAPCWGSGSGSTSVAGSWESRLGGRFRRASERKI